MQGLLSLFLWKFMQFFFLHQITFFPESPAGLKKFDQICLVSRDSDETPRFVRVEIILAGAVFCISFTDAHFYPPPIRIENLSDVRYFKISFEKKTIFQVPILYQQFAAAPTKQHLRTICKAKSHVDYAWDDLYGEKKILLQVDSFTILVATFHIMKVWPHV